MTILPYFSTIVVFIFAAAVLNRYRYKNGPHLLLWGIGLVMYGLGTSMEVVMSWGFSAWGLKVWYIMGAMLTAAWLGQGSVFLLVRKRGVALTMAGVLVVLSLLSVVLVATAPITEAAASYHPAQAISEQYKDILVRGGLITFLTISLNIYGTLTLVGGALYSAFLFWRKNILFERMLGNILIATGALMPAMAGSLVKAGFIDWLYLSELLGAILMFVGFLQATAGKMPVRQPVSGAAD